MTSATFQEQLTVPFFDTNSTHDINLSALFNELLLVSEHQLHQAGIDSQQMVEHGLGWVVTKYHLEISQLPQLNDKLTITTEANSYNKFFCYRTFIVTNDNGQEMLRLTSNWVMIDIEKRKITTVDPQIMAKLDCPFKNDIWRFPRIEKVDYTQDERIYRTRFLDIDVNGHVNNSIYLDWMIDSLEVDFLRSKQVQTLDIKYDREVQYGSNVICQVESVDDTTYHQIKSDNGINAQAKIKWRDRA